MRRARLPKLWRKKRGGRYAGSYYATIAGSDVNLGTSDAEDAHRRLLEAVRAGKRKFRDDMDVAADALEASGPAAGPQSPDARHAGDQQPAAAIPAPAAIPISPPAPDKPAIAPDQVIPPGPGPGEAEDMAAAAEAVGDRGPGDAGGDQEAAFDPNVLREMLGQAAEMIVELQLGMQAWIIRRRFGRVAGQVDPGSPLRKFAAAAWTKQLEIWFPRDLPLPPWILVLVLPICCVPEQLAKSTKPPEDAGKAAQ